MSDYTQVISKPLEWKPLVPVHPALVALVQELIDEFDADQRAGSVLLDVLAAQ